MKKNTLVQLKYNLRRCFGLLVFLTLNIAVAFSQPSLQWQKCIGGTNTENATSIVETPDGGFIMAGFTNSTDGDVVGSHGGYDYLVVKLTSTGIIQWQKCYGGTSNDYAYSIKPTSDGAYIIAGYSHSYDGDVTGHHAVSDFWIVKIDSLGTLLWQKNLGGNGIDIAYDVIQTFDGGYIVCGSSDSNNGDVSGNHGNSDYWVVKLDSAGNLQWEKSYGGSDSDGANSIIQLQDSSYNLIGYSYSSDGDVHSNSGLNDIWMANIDSNGSIISSTNFGGSDYEDGRGILQKSAYRYIITGSTASIDGDIVGYHSGGGGSDAWIAEVTNFGTIYRSKCLGGSYGDAGRKTIFTPDYGYLMVGSTVSTNGDVTGHHGGANNPDAWIVKLDSNLVIEWTECLGGLDWDFDDRSSVQLTSDGGIIICGNTASNNGNVSGLHGGKDAWVVKLSSVLTVPEFKNELNSMKVYPSPASNQLNISFDLDSPENISFRICDIMGKEIIHTTNYKFNSGNNEFTLDLNADNTWNIDDGVYLLSILEDSRISSKLILIQK